MLSWQGTQALLDAALIFDASHLQRPIRQSTAAGMYWGTPPACYAKGPYWANSKHLHVVYCQQHRGTLPKAAWAQVLHLKQQLGVAWDHAIKKHCKSITCCSSFAWGSCRRLEYLWPTGMSLHGLKDPSPPETSRPHPPKVRSHQSATLLVALAHASMLKTWQDSRCVMPATVSLCCKRHRDLQAATATASVTCMLTCQQLKRDLHRMHTSQKS